MISLYPYESCLSFNSLSVIFPTVPNICDANVPDGYSTDGFVTISMPGNSEFSSDIFILKFS